MLHENAPSVHGYTGRLGRAKGCDKDLGSAAMKVVRWIAAIVLTPVHHPKAEPTRWETKLN